MSRLIFDADTLGGTTTLSSADAVGNFTLTVPAVNGTLSVKDASGDATFRNLTLTGAVLAGAWNGSTITVPYGGTGATTLTGYVKGNGTSAMTASATIPNTDITGLGTMSTQNANAVAITGGTISGLSAAIPVASGGTGATTLTGYVKGNGTSLMTASATIPNTDITGLGTMSTQNANAVAITGGTISGLSTALAVASGGTGATTLTGLVYGNGTSAMTAASAAQVVAVIGSTAVANATLAATATLATTATNIAGGLSGSIPYQTAAGTTSLLAAGTNGQVLTLAAGLPSWVSVAGVGTVTLVDGSGGTTGLTLTGGPITSSGTLTLGGTLAVANGGTGVTSLGTGVVTALGVNVGTAGAVVVNGGALGTPSSGTLTNATGLSLTTGVTGTLPIANGGTGLIALGTGVQTAIGVNVGTAGAFVVNGGALGAPSSGTLTNATGLPVSTGINGLGTGIATALAVNVGSVGAPVVNGGALGTPSSGTVTNLTGTASININGTVGATTPTTGAFTTLSTSGVATFSAGAVGTPAITTTGDTNTGIFFPAADTIAFAEGGVEAMRLDSNGNVGIGTTTSASATALTVQIESPKNTVFQGTGYGVAPSINLRAAGGTASSPSATASTPLNIVGATTDDGTTFRNTVSIVGNIESTPTSTSHPTAIIFNTTSVGSLSRAERMRIDSSGNVGIGTSSPTEKLDVNGNSRTAIATSSDVYFKAQNSAGSLFFLQKSASAAIYTPTSQPLIFDIAGERMRIDSSGNVGIGTSSPNASALLDVQSTTKGVRMPNMTTTQKNAIASPAAGLMVFDTTLSKLAVYTGAAWQTITSV